MTKLSRISNSIAGRAAMLGGLAFGGEGITQLIHFQHASTSKVDGVAGHVVLACFIVACVSIAPSFIALARSARPGIAGKAALAAAAGTTVLGLTCITSMINGRDLGMFNVIAPLTNAAWLFGSVILAVSLKRAGKVPAAVAVGLLLAWFASIPLATLGGGLLSGGYFLAVGYLLASDAIERRAGRVAQPARI